MTLNSQLDIEPLLLAWSVRVLVPNPMPEQDPQGWLLVSSEEGPTAE